MTESPSTVSALPKEEEKSISSVDASHKALVDKIKKKKLEKNELKEITQNQLKNICELQKKCEESFIAVSQLPQNQKMASERFEEASKLTTTFQRKQCGLHELLNCAMKEFDENLQLIDKAKQQFNSEEVLANQRLFIYDADLKDLKTLGEKNILLLQQRVRNKNYLLEQLNSFLKSYSLHDMNQYLWKINNDISYLLSMSTKLENEISKVENNIRKLSEEKSSCQKDMQANLESSAQELNHWKTELENGIKHLAEVQEQIDIIMQSYKELECELIKLKGEISQLHEKEYNYEKELEDINKEIKYAKDELEKILNNSNNLRVIVEQVNVMNEDCSSKETLISNLEKQKEDLLTKASSLNSAVSYTTELISETSINMENVKLEIEKIRNEINQVESKINEMKEAKEKLHLTSEKNITDMMNEINSLKIIDSELTQSICDKTERQEELQLTLITKKQDYESKINELQERKEKNGLTEQEVRTTLNEVKVKMSDLEEKLKSKAEERLKKEKNLESIRTLNDKIESLKTKHKELVESLEKEKQDLKESTNKQLEDKVNELQALKGEKEKILEKVRDNTSKAEFSYFKLKSQAQMFRGELNCIKVNLKTYSCEYEMLKMLNSWLNASSQNSIAISDKQKTVSQDEDTNMPSTPKNEFLNNDGEIKIPELPGSQGPNKQQSSAVSTAIHLPAEDNVARKMMPTQTYLMSQPSDSEGSATKKKPKEEPLIATVKQEKPEGDSEKITLLSKIDQITKVLPKRTYKNESKRHSTKYHLEKNTIVIDSSDAESVHENKSQLRTYLKAKEKRNQHSQLDNDSEMKIPELPASQGPKKQQSSTVSTAIHLPAKRSAAPLGRKQQKKKAKEKTILDMVVDSTDSHSA